jgi:hypothetical protein
LGVFEGGDKARQIAFHGVLSSSVHKFGNVFI